jgi:hypothetical protein
MILSAVVTGFVLVNLSPISTSYSCPRTKILRSFTAVALFLMGTPLVTQRDEVDFLPSSRRLPGSH